MIYGLAACAIIIIFLAWLDHGDHGPKGGTAVVCG